MFLRKAVHKGEKVCTQTLACSGWADFWND